VQEVYLKELSLYRIAMYGNHPQSFEKGMLYYRTGKLIHVEYDTEIDELIALVRGKRDYRVEIGMSEDMEMIMWVDCSCPDSRNYQGLCKHAVAVLLKLHNETIEGIIPQYTPAQELFNYFSPDSFTTGAVPTRELQMELTLHLLPLDVYQRVKRSLTLKVGENRLYVVRNVQNFLEAYLNEDTLSFGKHFTFDPRVHHFAPADKPVIELLMEMYQWHRSFYNNEYGSVNTKVMKGKEIFFPSQTFKRLLDALQEHTFNLKLEPQHLFKKVKVVEDTLPLEFTLTQKNGYLRLGLKGEHNVIPLTGEGAYWYYDHLNLVYRIPEEQRRHLLPFYNALIRSREEELVLEKKHRSRFLGEVLPYLEKVGTVELQDKLKKALRREPLLPRVYLDYDEGTVTAKVLFVYGNREIDPFEEGNGNQGQVLVRDMEGEKELFTMLYGAGFITADQGVLCLTEEEKVQELLQDTLSTLREKAEVYYSDSFKRLKMRPAPRSTCRLSLRRESNLLEVELGLDGINQEELHEVWQSWKEKKKYHRLRDGSFLPLESEGLQELEELVSEMDLSEAELNRDKVLLHPAHALHLEQASEEGRVSNLEWGNKVDFLLKKIKEIRHADFQIPCSLQGMLRSYQETGFRWMKALAGAGLGGILADDMGLGKTLQTLAFILSEKEKEQRGQDQKGSVAPEAAKGAPGSTPDTDPLPVEAADLATDPSSASGATAGPAPVLVVAPTSVLYNWEAEARKFTSGLSVLVVSGTAAERKKLLDQALEYDLLVTSYALLRRDQERYREIRFSYCFLDEAQNIKNPRSQTAGAVKSLHAKSTFALTGTPVENSLVELWSIFNCVMPGFLPGYRRFVQKYSRAETGHAEEKVEFSRRLSQKVKPFILRRVKEEVLQELPRKIEHCMFCELAGEQKKIYAAYWERLRAEAGEELRQSGIQKSRIKILAGLTRLRQICCHPALFLEDYRGKSAKMDQLRELLQDLHQQGQRILLFSQFTSMLELIAGMLKKEGYRYFYLDGSVKTEDRLDMADKFNDGEGDIFLISLKAGGTGLNLTGADTVIQFDLWWNPAVEEQAAGRAHRMGQEKVVHVIKMLTRGTIEEKIHQLQQEKKDLVERVVHPGETLLTSLGEEELRQVLEL